jgi:hypothetical protein
MLDVWTKKGIVGKNRTRLGNFFLAKKIPDLGTKSLLVLANALFCR